MYRIAIVEDQDSDAQRLESALKTYSQEMSVPFSWDHWTSGEIFLQKYRHQYDIVFMDIRLAGIDGMETARRLRRMDSAVLLVFLTSLAQYAIAGYEVEAIDYIVKPLSYPALRLKMPRLLRRCSVDEQEIIISCNDQSVKLSPRHLLYAEIYDHHIQYMTQNGVMRGYGTLKELEASLPKEFFRVNNQTIVNLRHVTRVDGDNVIVGSREFPLSRRRRKSFLDALYDAVIRA